MTAFCRSTRSRNYRGSRAAKTRSSRWASASIKCGPPSSISSCIPARGFRALGWEPWGSACPPRIGAKAAFPDKLVVDIDGDGSFLMNIQELATCFCEKLPVKVLLLNNQHLGMVVQWEDRFFKGNRAHTYLGPIDHPEATGDGDGLGPAERYPDFVSIAKGFGCGARSVKRKAELTDAPARNDRLPGALPARCRSALSGACSADDSGWNDRAGFDQGIAA